MSQPARAQVLQALVAHFQAELDGVEAMARLAADEAVSDESRSEGKYDTRSIEASYLARGQAERVASLRAALSSARSLDPRPRPDDAPIGVGSVVCVQAEPAEPSWLVLVPTGGGARLRVAGHAVRVLTPGSPLGKSLLGAVEDDLVEVDLGGTIREYVVLRSC